MSGEPGWLGADSDVGRLIFVASVMMGNVYQTIGSSQTIFVSAFADVIGKGSAEMSDAAFEKALANLAYGIRMVRASAQSEKAVKS